MSTCSRLSCVLWLCKAATPASAALSTSASSASAVNLVDVHVTVSCVLILIDLGHPSGDVVPGQDVGDVIRYPGH